MSVYVRKVIISTTINAYLASNIQFQALIEQDVFVKMDISTNPNGKNA